MSNDERYMPTIFYKDPVSAFQGPYKFGKLDKDVTKINVFAVWTTIISVILIFIFPLKAANIIQCGILLLVVLGFAFYLRFNENKIQKVPTIIDLTGQSLTNNKFSPTRLTYDQFDTLQSSAIENFPNHQDTPIMNRAGIQQQIRRRPIRNQDEIYAMYTKNVGKRTMARTQAANFIY